MESVLIDQLSEQSRMWVSSTAKGEFLELGKNHFTNYFIFNALGKMEMKGSLNENRKIDIHGLSKGIYFVQFFFEDETQVTRQFMKI